MSPPKSGPPIYTQAYGSKKRPYTQSRKKDFMPKEDRYPTTNGLPMVSLRPIRHIKPRQYRHQADHIEKKRAPHPLPFSSWDVLKHISKLHGLTKLRSLAYGGVIALDFLLFYWVLFFLFLIWLFFWWIFYCWVAIYWIFTLFLVIHFIVYAMLTLYFSYISDFYLQSTESYMSIILGEKSKNKSLFILFIY